MTGIAPKDRPRERLHAGGPELLADRELLALLLRNGGPGISAIDLAAEMLAEFGSLHRLSEARPEELMKCKGVGEAKAAAVVAAFHLARRLAAENEEHIVIRTPHDVAIIAQRELNGARRERVLVLVCDSANRLRRTLIVSEGSMDRSLLPIREILNAALRHDGRAFALAHNHPSGDPDPSEADRKSTEALAVVARAVGLRFLGHVVVGSDKWAVVT